MARYRIRSRAVMEREYGYVGLCRHDYQDFQVKRWWGWQTLGTEEVPPYVASYHAVGGSGWLSKFSYFGHWGRDGVVTLYKAKPPNCQAKG